MGTKGLEERVKKVQSIGVKILAPDGICILGVSLDDSNFKQIPMIKIRKSKQGFVREGFEH
jgi:hypothetical protein